MKLNTRSVLLVSGLLLLAACGGQDAVQPDENTGFDPAGAESTAAETSTVETTPAWHADPLNHPDSPLQERVIYFGFDDANLTDQGRALVEAHAKFLAANPSQSVLLQGHADERGTREYNIALGQQRADSVRRMMLLYGVTPAQLRVISYGEEKPAVFGHDERSWALNRRVEVRY